MKPPDSFVHLALDQSRLSPCRSKRGVCIYKGFEVISLGYNYKPSFGCDGSIECKATCRREAIHAEQQALLLASLRAYGADLIHVKSTSNLLTISGPPSCVECSKLILAVGIRGVWLFHETGWRRYEATEFHRLSLANYFDRGLTRRPDTVSWG